ncbi:MAG: hypothetical protein OXC54_07740 [Rhodospirillaceae bacterium]|nr:hypothetical protein [Rhodospirillaceae bacterium]
MDELNLMRERVDIEPIQCARQMVPVFEGESQEFETTPRGVIVDACFRALKAQADILDATEVLVWKPDRSTIVMELDE